MQERFCLHHVKNTKLHTLPPPLQWQWCHHSILDIKLCASSWCSTVWSYPIEDTPNSKQSCVQTLPCEKGWRHLHEFLVLCRNYWVYEGAQPWVWKPHRPCIATAHGICASSYCPKVLPGCWGTSYASINKIPIRSFVSNWDVFVTLTLPMGSRKSLYSIVFSSDHRLPQNNFLQTAITNSYNSPRYKTCNRATLNL